MNHFQVSGVSNVFCNSHHICCRGFCLLWFWWSLSRLQHQFQRRHFLTKSFRSMSIQHITFCYIYLWGCLCWCTGCLALVCSCGPVGLSSNVSDPIYCYILEARNGGQLLTIFGTGLVRAHNTKIKGKPANKETQEPTFASKMDRVVSICCIRRDMLASFCRIEDKTSDAVVSLCDSAGAAVKEERKKTWRCTHLFTNYGETVKEPYCVHNKLIEIGDNSSLLNSRDLEETHAVVFGD